MGRLDGKVAIITGAAKGLGEADARLFAIEGAKVVLTDVDAENGERVEKEIGPNAIFIKHDVRKPEDWKHVIKKTVKTFGGLNVLVNNAGVVEIGTRRTLCHSLLRSQRRSRGSVKRCGCALR